LFLQVTPERLNALKNLPAAFEEFFLIEIIGEACSGRNIRIFS